jgi:hypothetical protein
MNRLACRAFLCLLGWSSVARAQDAGDIRDLKPRDWQPRSMLGTQATVVSQGRFPVIDVHNHPGGGKRILTTQHGERYRAAMDVTGIKAVLNLDGGWDEQLLESLATAFFSLMTPSPNSTMELRGESCSGCR